MEELPALGDTPGPLAAIWLVPASGEVVGLVAETGTFGTLPFDVYYDSELPAMEVALSPDGRRIAYPSPTQDLVVRDLVSGEDYSSAFVGLKSRRGFTWVDATHLVGHTARGSDIDGWVWQPGEAPKSVNLLRYPGSPYLGPHAGREPWFLTHVGEVRSCSAPTLQEMGAGVSRPVLCDVLGVIGPEIALTHDRDGTVVALDIDGVEDPALRRVVVDAGAPQLVTFATDLIREALDAGGGAS